MNQDDYDSLSKLAEQQKAIEKRDWFAGMALQVAWEARDNGYYEGDDNDMAQCAYQIADAMMKAREQ